MFYIALFYSKNF